jgi:thymidylate synthase (FAD)
MKVELINYFGDDLMVVNAARVSYGKIKNIFDDADNKLIRYLVNHKHIAPFRHPQLQFRIECPIFVERQLFKHQVGLSANSISGRYVDFSDKYWEIKTLRKQSKSSKQGSEGEIDRPDLIKDIHDHIENGAKLYSKLCEAEVAKEQARIILPLALETQFIWTGSLLSYLHFWDLRLKSDTQYETREIAQEMLTLVQSIEGDPFTHTLAAWGYNK